MRYLTLILFVTILAQVAHATGKHKRSPQTVRDIIDKAALGRRLVPITETVVKATIPKIPKRRPYKKYRKELKSYLNDVKEYKTVRGGCYAKTFDLLEKFAKILQKYEEADAPSEAKEMQNLMQQSGGNDMSENWSRYRSLHFGNTYNNMSAEDIRELTPHLQEIC
ncbi:uncharacterized protein [Musca autumnalis]|uniref:uncharacterized protein n=1 Tax=Musca autumnalis TaxID=221902 RepID=UPI003CF737F2